VRIQVSEKITLIFELQGLKAEAESLNAAKIELEIIEGKD